MTNHLFTIFENDPNQEIPLLVAKIGEYECNPSEIHYFIDFIIETEKNPILLSLSYRTIKELRDGLNQILNNCHDQESMEQYLKNKNS
jgi:hypothetical protein